MKRLIVVSVIVNAFVVVGIALFLVWYLNGLSPRDFGKYTSSDLNALKSDTLFLTSASIYGVFWVISTFISIVILSLSKRVVRGRGMVVGTAILAMFFLHPFAILAGAVALFTIQDSGMSMPKKGGDDPLMNKRSSVDVVGLSNSSGSSEATH